MKLCTVCSVVTSRASSRCTEHARESNRSRHNALYSTRAWQRLSARVLRAWRGERGDWCPGYGRPAHQASDLTVDHVVPLAAGGAPFDIGNTAVLCRSCNSTKGASTDDRAGRLWSGEESALGTLIDPGTWEHVQSLRARYSRRHRGSLTRRQYGLAGLLACAACGRHLIGHVGRYRHTDACDTFRPAAPRRVERDGATIDPGCGRVLRSRGVRAGNRPGFEHVAVSARLRTDTVAQATRPDPEAADELALARIKREREQAALRFAKDRDLGKLEATMARLDAEAAAAVVRPSRIPAPAEARAYLESLPDLWAKTSDAGRHAIAEAVFERIDVLGAPTSRLRPRPTPEPGVGTRRSAPPSSPRKKVDLVGARGIAPRPPTFRSRCGWPSLRSRSTGCAAHDETAASPSR